MRLRIGDKVRLLNEVGEGTVSRIKDKNTVFVEMADGFEIPFEVSQLVPIHTELIADRLVENIELNPEAHLTDAVYLVLEPDHEYPPLTSEFKIYLFNASGFNMHYTYSIKDEEYFQTMKHGEAGPYQKILLRQVKMQFFAEYHYHKLECIFFKNSFYKAQAPVAEVVHISPDILRQSKPIRHEEFKFPVYGFLLKDEFFDREHIRQDLTDEDLKKLRSIKEFKSARKVSKSNREYLRSLEKEVDLHINELVDSTAGMSNYEMLNIQLERFEKELDEAIARPIKKIIFIHGVGNGRLRQEIHAILKQTPGITYQDASFKEYGYGATQVNIL